MEAKNLLKNITDNFDNPEEINSTNPPSVRIKTIIEGYNKVIYGSYLAEEIGIEQMMLKNPRFNDWITKLQNL